MTKVDKVTLGIANSRNQLVKVRESERWEKVKGEDRLAVGEGCLAQVD